jgi:hypothetical protein
MAKQTDTAWIDVEILHVTIDASDKKPRAWLVTNGKTKAWLPASAIVDSDDDLKIGVHTRIEISTSLAEDKELV